MADPDTRPSEPPPPLPAPRPGPARVVDEAELVRQAALQLSEPLTELATAVRAAHDHLESDPEKAKRDLVRARAALEALRRELALLRR